MVLLRDQERQVGCLVRSDIDWRISIHKSKVGMKFYPRGGGGVVLSSDTYCGGGINVGGIREDSAEMKEVLLYQIHLLWKSFFSKVPT